MSCHMYRALKVDTGSDRRSRPLREPEAFQGHAKAHIALTCLVYNMCRYVQICRYHPAFLANGMEQMRLIG